MKYLIKFGEEKHLKRCIATEKFYFGRARTYIDIEKQSLEKGQGDAKEATLSLSGAKGCMVDKAGHKLNLDIVNLNVLVDVAADIPIYCMSQITLEKDCVSTKSGYKLSDEFLEKIKRDFPKADSAIIIKDSEKFIDTFRKQICSYSDTIKYFTRVENGVTSDYISTISSEITKEKYEESKMYNIINIKSKMNDGTVTYNIVNKKNAHKILFSKDSFFSNQLEYRIVLPNKRIQTKGMEYFVKGSKRYMKFITINELENSYFL